ncbi:MAG: DUF2341 domain-containing protein [Bacteroidota bacterium]
MRKLFLFFLSGVLSCTFLFAQNCLTGWSYFQSVSLHNPASEDWSETNVFFTLDAPSLIANNKLQADGADLRLLDMNCEPVDFYFDTLGGSGMGRVWLDIPFLAAGDSLDFQLYYGNDTARSVAAGDSVFLFFDDFSSGVVDSNKWEPIGGYAKLEIVNGRLRYASNGANPGPRYKFLRTKMAFQQAHYFDFRAQISNSNAFGFSSADSTIERIMIRQSVFGFDTLNQIAFLDDTLNNGFQVEGLYPIIRFPRGETRDGSIRASIQDSMLTLDYFANLNENSVSEATYQLTQTQMTGFHFMITSFLSNQTIYLDYLIVRKPEADTVGVTKGPEEMAVANPIDPALALSLQVFPNPTTGQFAIEGLPSGRFELSMVNLMGQKVFQTEELTAGQARVEIELPALPQGQYWLLVQEKGQLRYAQTLVLLHK